MLVYSYPTWRRKWRRHPEFAAVVNAPNIPFELDINKQWFGIMLHADESNRFRQKDELYVGVIASHSSKTFLIKVPANKEKLLPTKTVASGE